MPLQKTGIVTDCICDLPRSYIREHNIGIIYFLIETDSGIFTDTDEITAENILSYMAAGGVKSVSSPPPAEDYAELFGKTLEKYGEVLFIAAGSGSSVSYDRARETLKLMGTDAQRIRVFDSGHLSTGLGHMVIRAAEMAESGCGADEIVTELSGLKERVSTTFLTVNADYLYRNGRASERVKRLCDTFGIHPVLMMKNGAITLKSVMIGNYEKASLRYVRRALKNAACIDGRRIFITHAGCGKREIGRISEEIYKKCSVEELIVTKASATVSSNCGPGTFGVLFVNERNGRK